MRRMQAFGRAALMTTACTHPVEFVRVLASLMPRELEATITSVTELMLDRCSTPLSGEVFKVDPAATDGDAQIIIH